MNGGLAGVRGDTTSSEDRCCIILVSSSVRLALTVKNARNGETL